MVNISNSGNSIVFNFTDSDFYLYGTGTIETPVNSLALYVDDSDMITFKKAASNDIFVSVPLSETNFSTKADAITFYKENMVGPTGGSADAFTDVSYDSDNEEIIFYNEDGEEVATLDASAFVIDGMIDDVYIDNGYLVIDFNTASGKQDIRIPLTDIFPADDYYTKQDVDLLLVDYQPISGLSSITLSTFVNDADFVTTAVTDAISTALNTLSGDVSTISGDVQTKQDQLTAGSGITIVNNVISATGGEIPTKLSELENDCGFVSSAVTDSLSGIIEQNELIVASALVDLDERKADLSGITDYSSEISAINASISALNASISALSTSMDTKEEVISRALNSLNTRLGGLSLIKITQSEYAALVTKDPNVLYVVIPDPNTP